MKGGVTPDNEKFKIVLSGEFLSGKKCVKFNFYAIYDDLTNK
jgi:hypothetical protein